MFLTNSVALSVVLVDDGQLDLVASVASWPMHCAWLYGGQDAGGEANAARARWSMMFHLGACESRRAAAGVSAQLSSCEGPELRE